MRHVFILALFRHHHAAYHYEAKQVAKQRYNYKGQISIKYWLENSFYSSHSDVIINAGPRYLGITSLEKVHSDTKGIRKEVPHIDELKQRQSDEGKCDRFEQEIPESRLEFLVFAIVCSCDVALADLTARPYACKEPKAKEKDHGDPDQG